MRPSSRQRRSMHGVLSFVDRLRWWARASGHIDLSPRRSRRNAEGDSGKPCAMATGAAGPTSRTAVNDWAFEIAGP
jgi:hypothetical protein